MIGHFEGTITGVFEEKKRGEYRSFFGKVPARKDYEKIALRLLCLFLLSLVMIQTRPNAFPFSIV